MLFRDKSGTISQTELEEALRVFGYNLSSQVENYRHDQLTLQLSADTTLPGSELPPWSADIAVISGYDLRSTIICWCCSYQLPGREQPYYHDQLILQLSASRLRVTAMTSWNWNYQLISEGSSNRNHSYKCVVLFEYCNQKSWTIL